MIKLDFKRLTAIFLFMCLGCLQLYTAFHFESTITTAVTGSSSDHAQVPVPFNKQSITADFVTSGNSNAYPRIVLWFPQEQQLHAVQSNHETAKILKTQQQQQQHDSTFNTTLPNRQRHMEPIQGACFPDCRAKKEQEEKDRLHHPALSHYVDDCQPMAEWQSRVHPTCNALHETNTMSRSQTTSGDASNMEIKMIDYGGTRTVWQVSNTFLDERVILKLLHYELETSFGFGYRMTRFWDEPMGFWMNEVESMAMDQLTSSPGVVNIYAHCGQSQLSELATEFLHDAVNSGTIDDPWMRLGMAVDIAWALSDIHSIDFANASNPTLAHADLHNENVVAIDGKWKILDLNRAIPLKWNVEKDAPCGFEKIGGDARWRAPETFARSGHADPAKADIYSMGGILFYLLTSEEPFRSLEPGGKIVRKILLQGKENGTMVVPHVPQEFQNSSDPSQQVLYQAAMDCFQFRPLDRLTSYQLALHLQQAYDRVVRQQHQKKARV